MIFTRVGHVTLPLIPLVILLNENCECTVSFGVKRHKPNDNLFIVHFHLHDETLGFYSAITFTVARVIYISVIMTIYRY